MTHPLTEHKALKLSRDVALAVGDAIEPLVGEKRAADKLYMGADGTPTHRIDDVAEKVALDELEGSDISMRVISEEAGERIFGDDPLMTVILDPIDGTTNVLSGIPFYSISIGFGNSTLSDVWFGYVYDLAHSLEYTSFQRDSGSVPSSDLDIDVEEYSSVGHPIKSKSQPLSEA